MITNTPYSDSWQQPDRFVLTQDLPVNKGRMDFILGDWSYSMLLEGFEFGMTKLDLMRDAAGRFVYEKVRKHPHDTVAVIMYSYEASWCCPPLQVGTHCNKILAAIREFEELPHLGTQLWTGLDKIMKLLNEVGYSPGSTLHDSLFPGAIRIIAYSDGHDQAQEVGIELASQLKAMGVMIETLGIGKNRESVAEDFLKKVATTELDGKTIHYRFLGDPESIKTTFTQLGEGHLVI